MLKFVIPVIIIFLTIIFWEKISEKIRAKFNIRLNYLIVSVFLLAVAIIILLLNY